MTKEQVREMMLGADTPEECTSAWEAREEYLREHPDELRYFLDAGEQLKMIESGFEAVS